MRPLATLLLLAIALNCARDAQDVERERALRVRVVDARGAPVAGVPVRLAFGKAPPPALAWRFAPCAATAESDSAGWATFEAAERWAAEEPGLALIAGIELPLPSPVETEVDRASLEPRRRELELPPCGEVELLLPDIRNARATLHVAGRDEGTGLASWIGRQSQTLDVHEGRVRFARVGLGLALELDVERAGLLAPLRVSFAGPREPGEVVSQAIPGRGGARVLTGRLLDWRGRPLADREVSATLLSITWDTQLRRRTAVSLDAQGRFRVECAFPPDSATLRHGLEFWDALEGEELDGNGPPRAFVVPDPAWNEREQELGDVVLSCSGDAGALRRISDDELAKEWRLRTSTESLFGDEVEACLLEMARRGGSRWVDFLEEQAAPHTLEWKSTYRRITEFLRPRIRVSEGAPVRSDSSYERPPELPDGGPGQLAGWKLLTALRRAQRRPDPLAVVLQGDVGSCGFLAKLGTVDAALWNTDPTKGFRMSFVPGVLRGRSAGLDVQVTDAQGVSIPPDPWAWGRGGGMFLFGPVGPGEIQAMQLDLREYFRGLGPGDYTLSLQFHPGASPPYWTGSSAGIFASSKPIHLRIDP